MFGRLLGVAVLWAVAAAGQDVIYFERVFPGAVPERFEVTLGRDGKAVYAEEGGDSLELSLRARAVAEVFDFAEALDRFRADLASKRRVASTGKKVLRFEEGGRIKGEARFDYSEIPEARAIASWFVRLAETNQHLQELERAYRFDRLGVNHALVNLEQAYERDRIVAPGLLEPILGRIAGQPRIVNLARARAEGLLERIAAARLRE